MMRGTCPEASIICECWSTHMLPGATEHIFYLYDATNRFIRVVRLTNGTLQLYTYFGSGHSSRRLTTSTIRWRSVRGISWTSSTTARAALEVWRDAVDG